MVKIDVEFWGFLASKGMFFMIHIKVKPFSHLKDLMGGGELAVQLDGQATVGDALEELCWRFGEKLREALMNPQTGKVRPYYRVLVGGKDFHQMQDLDTRLSEGDVVSVFSPVAGR